MSATRVTLTALLSLLLLLGAACSDDSSSGGSKSGGGSGGGTLRVENNSSQSIFRVRFSRTTDSNWGDDRLGAAEVISAGDSRDWKGVKPGNYHVKIEFGNGDELDSLEEYTISSGETTNCVISGQGGGSGGGTLRVENNSSQSIFRVRFSRTTDSNWGDDRLGAAEVISAGDWRDWSGLATGNYHVKVEFGNGDELDSLEEYTISPGQTTSCTVYNN